MARFRRSIPALATAALFIGGLALVPIAASQDEAPPERESKIGTREQKTMDVDWDALRRDRTLEPVPEPAPIPPDGVAPEPPSPMIGGFPREKLRETRLPVLMPRDSGMVERMRLFAERDRYVASLREEDISVQIMGTRISQGSLQSKGAAERMKRMSDQAGYLYQHTEYGCELSFTRYNVSYSISVECRKPESDPRCTEKSFIMKLANSLVYVGGMPEEEDQ